MELVFTWLGVLGGLLVFAGIGLGGATMDRQDRDPSETIEKRLKLSFSAIVFGCILLVPFTGLRYERFFDYYMPIYGCLGFIALGFALFVTSIIENSARMWKISMILMIFGMSLRIIGPFLHWVFY